MERTENKKYTVAIIGASDKPDRYSYKALKLLKENNYEVIPINPVLEEIEGVKVYRSISIIEKKIDTITLYINPDLLKRYIDEIIRIKPRRVIFNPGTESSEIEEIFEKSGIQTIEACTLVMLRTGQF